MRSQLLNTTPILAGLLLANETFEDNNCSRHVTKLQRVIFDAVHLHDCVKHVTGANIEWETIDRYLEIHNEHHFGTAQPENFHDCYVRYQLGRGLSHAAINAMNASTARRSSRALPATAMIQRQNYRPAKSKTPLLSFFNENNAMWGVGVNLTDLSDILKKAPLIPEEVAEEEAEKKKEAEKEKEEKEEEEKIEKPKSARGKKIGPTDESTPIAVVLLRRFQFQIQRELQQAEFDYFKFHDECKAYLERIRDRLESPRG